MALPEDAALASQPEDSLRRRFLFKLGTNLAGLLSSSVTVWLVPRSLGPVAYGEYSFLTTFFSQLVGFLDAGTSTGFYTKLSQRLREPELIRFYWGFAGLVALVAVLFVQGASVVGWEGWLWPDQEKQFIWMAVLLALLLWCSQIINRIVDAYALTVGGEVTRLQRHMLGVALLVLLVWLHRLTLTTFFLYNYVLLAFLCWGWWRVLRKRGVAVGPRLWLTTPVVRKYAREFYEYSSPLFTYSLAGFVFVVLDRWMLQTFAGSAEQGFYGLSYRIATICFLFTAAMTPLFTRDFSQAFGHQDVSRMRALFQRYPPMLYAAAAFFSVFVAVQADKLSLIFGKSFHGVAIPVAIMALYPAHQTYGQLSGSVFFATGRTRLYRNLGIGMGLLALPITFWLIGPRAWSGLDLGATGLAIKMVGVQFVGVNLQLWHNCSLLELPFGRFLWHQVYSLALFGACALGLTAAVDSVLPNRPVAFLTAGTLYTVGCAGIVLLVPSILAMTRGELRGHVAHLWPRQLRAG